MSFFDDAKDSQRAVGSDFEDRSGKITNSIRLHPFKSTIDSMYDVMRKQLFPGCLARVFEASIKAELQKQGRGDGPVGTIGEVRVERFAIDDAGDRGTGFRTTVPVRAGNESTSVYVDLLFVQRGRVGLTLSFTTSGGLPDREVELQLVRTMVDRLGQKAP